MRLLCLILLSLLCCVPPAFAQPVLRWAPDLQPTDQIQQQLFDVVAKKLDFRLSHGETAGPIDVSRFWQGTLSDSEVIIYEFAENDTLRDGTLQEDQVYRLHGLAFSSKTEDWQLDTFVAFEDHSRYQSHRFEVVLSEDHADTIGIATIERISDYHCDEAPAPDNAISHESLNCITRTETFYQLTPTGKFIEVP